MILSEISTISAGHPFRGKIPEAPGSGIYAVQMKDVSVVQGINWVGCIETEPVGRSAAWLEQGDILVAARGNHNYAVLVSEPPVAAVAAPHFFVVRAKEAALMPEFLVWLLNQRQCQRYFEQNAEGSVTKSIRRSVLEATPIAIPPLERQKAVMQLVSTLREEQRVLYSLVQSNEALLGSIAADLINEYSPAA